MIYRASASLLIGLTLIGNVLADMAPPSPTPTASGGTGGISFGTYDVSRHLTPLGWLFVVAVGALVVFLSIQFVRTRNKAK